MRTIGRNFSYEGMTVRVESRCPSDLQWLQEFLLPWFDLSDQTPEVEVELRVDPQQFDDLGRLEHAGEWVDSFMMDTHIVRYPQWVLPDHSRVLYDQELALFMHLKDRRIDIIAQQEDPWSRLQLMRVVRELAMGAAQARGGRFLHAAALALTGRAIIVAGRRKAGKTSLLTYLLSHLDAGLMTNDRLLVLGHGAVVKGMPTIVSIRNAAMALFPEIQKQVTRNHLTTRLTLEECREADASVFDSRHPEKLGLSPAQFCTVTNSAAARDAVGGILLFPEQSRDCSGITLRELDMSAARSALNDGLFGNIGPECLSDVFTLHACRGNNLSDESFLQGLSTALPAYRCTLGPDAYDSANGAEQIMRLLDKSSAAGAHHIHGNDQDPVD